MLRTLMFTGFLHLFIQNNACKQSEELVLQPEKARSSICDFLEIRYDSGVLLAVEYRITVWEYQQDSIDVSRAVAMPLPVQ